MISLRTVFRATVLMTGFRFEFGPAPFTFTYLVLPHIRASYLMTLQPVDVKNFTGIT
jgi:hypothetical protein